MPVTSTVALVLYQGQLKFCCKMFSLLFCCFHFMLWSNRGILLHSRRKYLIRHVYLCSELIFSSYTVLNLTVILTTLQLLELPRKSRYFTQQWHFQGQFKWFHFVALNIFFDKCMTNDLFLLCNPQLSFKVQGVKTFEWVGCIVHLFVRICIALNSPSFSGLSGFWIWDSD